MEIKTRQRFITVPSTPDFRSHAAPGSSFCPGSHPEFYLFVALTAMRRTPQVFVACPCLGFVCCVFSWLDRGCGKKTPEVRWPSCHITSGHLTFARHHGGYRPGHLAQVVSAKESCSLSYSLISLAATQGEAAHPLEGGS